MTFKPVCAWVVALFIIAFSAAATPAGREVFFSEDFDDLSGWEPFYFRKIKVYSEYKTERSGGESHLVAISNSSASALLYNKEFDVYKYPRVKWRWKITGVYDKGDAREKSGDDYPVRIYIMFKYDPGAATFGKKVKYGLARRLYGQYPPHSSLNYIWANRRHDEGIIPSPYAEESRMVVLRWGEGEVGRWVEEEVDILEDYRRAF
jgi:hypothetical protein